MKWERKDAAMAMTVQKPGERLPCAPRGAMAATASSRLHCVDMAARKPFFSEGVSGEAPGRLSAEFGIAAISGSDGAGIRETNELN